MNRHEAMYQAARRALRDFESNDPLDIARAIADAIEVGLRRAGFDDNPLRRGFERCDQLGLHPSHIWWAQPPTHATDEAAWCDGQYRDPPERQLVQRYVDAGDGPFG